MKTSLIIPTLNEIDGVKAIMPRIDKSWCDEIIVVDGGSTDGTIEWLRSHGYRVLIQEKKGIGHGYRQAQAAATGDILITFSPDGNSVPERIPGLVSAINKGYDLVIVSRYLDGAVSEDDDWLTGFGNRLFTWLINVIFGGSYTDSLVIFRAYRKEILERLNIDSLDMTYDAQISIRAAKHKLKVFEIPGSEPKRIGGTRKMKPFKTGLGILREILRGLTF